jgi:LemA protein
MKLSTGWIVAIAIIFVLFLLTLWGVSSYNNLVTKEETVNTQWANVP